MALWAVDIEKGLLQETWTNRYIVQADNINAASVTAGSIVNLERAVHFDVVSFLRYRVRDIDPSSDVFVITPIGTVGTLPLATSSYLPLFNVIRVDFAAEAGRPSRKYLRLPIIEEWNENGLLPLAVQNQIRDSYATPLVGIGAFVDVDGQQIVGAAVFRPIGMRQLRRGSKRRATPVLG